VGASAQGRPEGELWNLKEFMACEGDRLVGYLGVNCFGGAGMPPEAMGMVHPDCRRRGVFRALYDLAVSEWRRRGVKSALLLSDGRSRSGLGFIETTGAARHHAEYGMYLRDERAFAAWPEGSVAFRKATNADAGEVARQNAIYFGDEPGSGDETGSEPLLPEVEEQRGMTISLAAAGGGGAFSLLIAFSAMKIAAAMITKSKMFCRNMPYLTRIGAPAGSVPRLNARALKFTPPTALANWCSTPRSPATKRY